LSTTTGRFYNNTTSRLRTTTTTSTITLITVTTTTGLPKVEGQLNVDVPNPASLIAEPLFTTFLQGFIGHIVGANAADVEIFFDLSRRLKASLRRLASFRVNYIVTFPTGIDPVAKAALLSDVTAPEITSAINTALTDELGANAPVVTVTSHAAAAVVHVPTTTVAGTTAVASDASSTVTTTVSIAGTNGTDDTVSTTKDLLSSLFEDIVASAAGHTPQFTLTFVLMFFCRSVHQA